jgi:PEP-CTERM motif
MRLLSFGLGLMLWVATAAMAQAELLTVNWAPDSSIDGTGTGVLNGTTVTYFTATGFNAGETFSENWASYLGTMGATGGSVSFQLGGVLGGAALPTGTAQTITFSSTIVNPVLLVNFLGGLGNTFDSDTLNFGTNTFTVLSENNAVQSGNSMLATSSVTDSADDGFGIQFNGTFGPGTPLVFNYGSDGLGLNNLQTVAFTIGIPAVATTPEPSTLALVCIGAVGLAYNGWYRSKQGAKR